MAKAKSAAVAAQVLKNEDAEETTSTAVAMTGKESLPANYRVKKVLTLPALVMKTIGDAKALRFDTAIHESKVPGKQRKDGTFEDPAKVAHVTDLDTGEQLVFMVPAVVLKNISDGYPEDDYVGRCFFIKNMGKRKSDQRYTDFGIAEIEANA